VSTFLHHHARSKEQAGGSRNITITGRHTERGRTPADAAAGRAPRRRVNRQPHQRHQTDQGRREKRRRRRCAGSSAAQRYSAEKRQVVAGGGRAVEEAEEGGEILQRAPAVMRAARTPSTPSRPVTADERSARRYERSPRRAGRSSAAQARYDDVQSSFQSRREEMPHVQRLIGIVGRRA